jgi:hypothetical protein
MLFDNEESHQREIQDHVRSQLLLQSYHLYLVVLESSGRFVGEKNEWRRFLYYWVNLLIHDWCEISWSAFFCVIEYQRHLHKMALNRNSSKLIEIIRGSIHNQQYHFNKFLKWFISRLRKKHDGFESHHNKIQP